MDAASADITSINVGTRDNDAPVLYIIMYVISYNIV